MDSPNPPPIDMRHTKLKPQEAALIAGELVKPSWASRNEGIHERISFEDTLWGFEMGGGAYYKTPLRVTYVRPDSRAEKACIRMGDTVLRISGQDTATLTLQEAHQLVLEAGINLKIVVTSPEDQVNAHYDYEDPVMAEQGLTAEQLKEMELERVRKALERASRCRQLQWPWVRRKWVIYRESNCFMVPSKYENKHRDKFTELPSERIDYFFPVDKANELKNVKNDGKNTKANESSEKLEEKNEDEEFEEVEEEVEEETQNEEHDTNERLEGKKGIENSEDGTDQHDSNVNVDEHNDNDADHLENPVENSNNESSLEESTQKDSDQGLLNYEVDNNNNHVAKSKLEVNEPSQDVKETSDDRIIDEMVENPSGLTDVVENIPKTDDDVIDSVLNDNEDSKDSQNER